MLSQLQLAKLDREVLGAHGRKPEIEDNMNKWELCFVRPQVRVGAEVVFFHPDIQKNKQHRNLADFVKSRGQKPEEPRLLLGVVISLILSDGWEPLNIGGGTGEWIGINPDSGATGFAFRRQVGPT